MGIRSLNAHLVDADGDLQPYELQYPDRMGEIFTMPADTALRHRWYYFPAMHAGECLFFTQYDSRKPGAFVFHTAFDEHSGNTCQSNAEDDTRSNTNNCAPEYKR